MCMCNSYSMQMLLPMFIAFYTSQNDFLENMPTHNVQFNHLYCVPALSLSLSVLNTPGSIQTTKILQTSHPPLRAVSFLWKSQLNSLFLVHIYLPQSSAADHLCDYSWNILHPVPRKLSRLLIESTSARLAILNQSKL